MNEIPTLRRKAGEIREDGFVFKGYRRQKGRVYEHWYSPAQHEAWRKYQAQWHQKHMLLKKQDPEWVARRRDYARTKQRKVRREQPEQQMLIRARKRALDKNLEFNLEQHDVVIPALCPVLGIPLSISDGGPTDTSPELDRIDNTKGYVKGNVIVVSRRANRTKSDNTPEELMAIAKFYTKLKRKNHGST